MTASLPAFSLQSEDATQTFPSGRHALLCFVKEDWLFRTLGEASYTSS